LTIRELRILPPLAIGRLGSAKTPLDNFTIDLDIDPQAEKPLGYRPIRPAPTLVVDEDSGAIRKRVTPAKIEFKHEQQIRPVAPFLEVFAIVEDGTPEGALTPLTLKLLKDENLSIKDIGWRALVSNRKVERRTGDPGDRVVAMIPEPAAADARGLEAAREKFDAAPRKWIGDHDAHTLRGRCDHFSKHEDHIDFGHVRLIMPTPEFPEIRLRFTPAKGLIYGPKPLENDPGPITLDPHAPKPYHVPDEQAFYDRSKGDWVGFGPHMQDEQKKSTPPKEAFFNETVPPSLFAIDEPAPPWLYDNNAVSRGYLDDACDGFVEVRLKRNSGEDLTATARICAAPPALAPDSLFVRNLADDLEQVVRGPKVEGEKPEETLARAQDIVRRAYETVRFMNVAVMNGNDVNGRPALSLDSMPEEEAADTQRAIRPVMPAATVDTLAIMALHQQAYAALQTGAAPWFTRLLRKPDEAGDFSDRGRRKMPALMCGADNNYLALTWRQIDTIEKAAREAAQFDLTPKPAPRPRNMTALKRDLVNQINYEAAGNPISSRPVTSVANCCPGLEMDFRAVWRRMFKGIVLREHDNLVIAVDADIADVKPVGDHGVAPQDLAGHRLLRIYPPGEKEGVSVIGEMRGPSSSDAEGTVLLTSDENPDGVAPLEWSNALAKIVATCQGVRVACALSKEVSQDKRVGWDPENVIVFEFEVRNFFDKDTAVISQALADAGELTQGLCSPWQNDYRECSCYYWASARPDFVNVAPGPNGLSVGDNWMQRTRTGSYVADDYADRRLIMYDELFRDWEKLLKFEIGGHDVADDPAEP
jgi:hypothetical protein